MEFFLFNITKDTICSHIALQVALGTGQDTGLGLGILGFYSQLCCMTVGSRLPLFEPLCPLLLFVSLIWLECKRYGAGDVSYYGYSAQHTGSRSPSMLLQYRVVITF